MCDTVATNQYFYERQLDLAFLIFSSICACNIWAVPCDCEGSVPAVAAAVGRPTPSGLDCAVVSAPHSSVLGGCALGQVERCPS